MQGLCDCSFDELKTINNKKYHKYFAYIRSHIYTYRGHKANANVENQSKDLRISKILSWNYKNLYKTIFQKHQQLAFELQYIIPN